MDKLNINAERQVPFWNTYKYVVHNAIMSTRSSRIGQIKNMFIEKCQIQNGM